MFESCPTLDDTCPDCVSGSPGCELETEGNIVQRRKILPCQNTPF